MKCRLQQTLQPRIQNEATPHLFTKVQAVPVLSALYGSRRGAHFFTHIYIALPRIALFWNCIKTVDLKSATARAPPLSAQQRPDNNVSFFNSHYLKICMLYCIVDIGCWCCDRHFYIYDLLKNLQLYVILFCSGSK
jgi:hypothetical protein